MGERIDDGRGVSRETAVATVLTGVALVAFAGNSVLCRLALGSSAIDPHGFTAIRVGSGALTLLAISALRRPRRAVFAHGSWRGALWLLLYALPFSLAYTRLTTGTGALLLFGAVQLTMITGGIAAGERPRSLEWLGLAGAVAGLVYLVFPGLTAPDPIGAAFMVAGGVGWGLYSLAGKGARDPLSATAASFGRATILAVPLVAAAWPWLSATPGGVLLAVVSGSLTSGVGYAIWYAALRHLSATRAALVQLAVPPLAALGGVALLGESVGLRLAVAGPLILGSIALGTFGRAAAARNRRRDGGES